MNISLEIIPFIFTPLFFLYHFFKPYRSKEERYIKKNEKVLISYVLKIKCVNKFQCFPLNVKNSWEPFAPEKKMTVVGCFSDINNKYVFFAIELLNKKIISSHFFYPKNDPFEHLIQVAISVRATGNSLIKELIDLDDNPSNVFTNDMEPIGMSSYERPKLISVKC